MRYMVMISLMLLVSASAVAQPEILTNAIVMGMVRAGLSDDIVIAKLRSSEGVYDTSSTALIELQRAGVSKAVILVLLERSQITGQAAAPDSAALSKVTRPALHSFLPTPGEAVRNARTIALVKSSVQPSRQALENELMKRPEWKALDLTLVRYKDQADLYVEIGYVSMSWITHRYVYRVYDRRSGAVLAAGETTSWGSLAENLARHIARSLTNVSRSN